MKEQSRNWTFSINEDILLACDQIFARNPANKFANISEVDRRIEVDGYYFEEKFCIEQYMYIRTTRVLSTCFCNVFLTTKRIAPEPWNLHP